MVNRPFRSTGSFENTTCCHPGDGEEDQNACPRDTPTESSWTKGKCTSSIKTKEEEENYSTLFFIYRLRGYVF